MGDLAGEPHFLGVPEPWLPDLGRLAVLSARMEHDAYQVAVLLRVKRPNRERTRSVSIQAKLILESIKSQADGRPWYEELVPGWTEQARSWLVRAPEAVERTRNRFLHANFATQKASNGQWIPVMLWADFSGVRGSVTATDLRAAVEELSVLTAEGDELWMGLVVAIQRFKRRDR